MAAGLQVVAVRASGVQDMVDDGIDGILTNADIDEFADAVCRVLEDDNLYMELKSNALIKAESLSSRNMALKLEAVYQQLIDNRTYRPNRLLDVGGWFSDKIS